MIDPLLSLSFNLHSQKGTYALLLGSGVSRAAGIPTGWEVTLDLISKLARLQNEKYVGNEALWYEKKYGRQPDYSELLAQIAPKAATQQQLLKAYFEPTAEERSEGKKLPTAAHHAIAQLVTSGHVNVIVTTNFDRLLEGALENQGIPATVIDSSNKATGAPPLAHSRCTVIKVHGDYLDHRIKNSPDALASYEPAMNRLLNRVFEDYGLIICGWSGEYDTALRSALERVKSRRYPLYWVGRSAPKGVAKNLINLHGASFIQIEGADQFFVGLCDKVEALDEFARPHPLSVASAVATLKRYLSEDRFRIQLNDFVTQEAGNAVASINAAYSVAKEQQPTQQLYSDLLSRFESACEVLIHIFAIGAFYGREKDSPPFYRAFELVAAHSNPVGGVYELVNAKKYPCVLLAYVCGIAALAADSFDVFKVIAEGKCYLREDDTRTSPIPALMSLDKVADLERSRHLLVGQQRTLTPLHDRVHKLLREPFRPLIPNDKQFEDIFTTFEYLWCLLHVDAHIEEGNGDFFVPSGRFCRTRIGKSQKWYRDSVKESIEKQLSLRILDAGLFGGKLSRLKTAFFNSEESLAAIAKHLRFF